MVRINVHGDDGGGVAMSATSSSSSMTKKKKNSSLSRFGPGNGNGNYNHSVSGGGSVMSGEYDSITGSSAGGDNNNNDDGGRLGAMDGVFLPCIQTILGVILFLRLTSITAQAGVLQTTLIILMCTTSTLPTALSLSAIATNGTIQAGGPYYVISRTLGAEIGGAIGLLFFVGTTGSASMYVLGAVEALMITIGYDIDDSPTSKRHTQFAALVLMLMISSLVNVGEHHVNRSSNFFLFCVLLSVISMLVGVLLFSMGIYDGDLTDMDRISMDNIWPNYEPDVITEVTPTLFSLVAIFYPSVTGILAGSNRSAMLANPAESIPSGTLGAILFTTIIYIITVWMFGCFVANDTLKDNRLVVAMIAYPSGLLVMIGIIMSSIGAALQCMAGAPRLLAAIALDDSIPFLKFIKPPNEIVEPTKSIWVTWALASALTLSGNLDKITPIITMFFLLMYSGINLSCFFLDVLKAPGFRPTFKYFHWTISLFGFVWCLGLALIISWYTACTAFLLFFLLYMYNKRQQLKAKDWGDVGIALRYNCVTQLLKQLTGTTSEDFHAKNWRPQLLTLIDIDIDIDYSINTNTNTNNDKIVYKGNPTNLSVLRLAAQLNYGRGINMVFSVLQQQQKQQHQNNSSTTTTSPAFSFSNYDTCELVSQSREMLQQHMKRERMDGFEEVFAIDGSKSEAIWSAVIHSGLGPLSPNSVMLSWPTNIIDSIHTTAGNITPINANKKTITNKHWQSAEEYVSTLRGIMNMKKAILLLKGSDKYPCSTDCISHGSIDVWWVVHDGGLLLLLPYLLSQNKVWRQSRLRLFAVITSGTENPQLLHQAVTEHLQQVRISASVTVVDLSHTDIAEDMRNIDDCVVDTNNTMGANTQHSTVGEVFSNFVYDVPYRPVGDLENAIGAELGFHEFTNAPPSVLMSDDNINDSNNIEKGDFGGSSDNRRKETAVAINAALQEYSKSANLVVTNMPLIRSDHNRPEWAQQYMEYVDLMTKGIDNVLLVRGSGAEVITTYA